MEWKESRKFNQTLCFLLLCTSLSFVVVVSHISVDGAFYLVEKFTSFVGSSSSFICGKNFFNSSRPIRASLRMSDKPLVNCAAK